MANNEILKQIISNIKILNDLTDDMKDSEIYPVSFFSQAFDLIQKLQSDFHNLEADQVELFAKQMKEHQALILSIHQQMRTIDGTSNTNKQVKLTPPILKAETENQIKNQKESEDNEVDNNTNTKDDTAKSAIKAPEEIQNNTENKKAAPIIENPIQIPPKIIKQEIETSKENSEPTIKKTVKSEPVPLSTIAKTKNETIQTESIQNEKEKSLNIKHVSSKEELSNNKATKTTIKDVIENKVAAIEQKETQTEENLSPSVNDIIEKKKLSDLRKAFSLNDRFRYKRELFNGSEDAMNKVIVTLNHKESYKESLAYLEEKLHWDFGNPTVKDFIKMLKIRFL